MNLGWPQTSSRRSSTAIQQAVNLSRGKSRVASLLVILSLAVGGGVAVPAAGQAGAGATALGKSKSSYVRKFGYIQMKDGTRLAYVVYLPTKARRHPAVLQYEPYQGGGIDPNERWLKAGYAVITANVRGSGCSTGDFDLFGPHEGPDGAEVVEWIGRQPWSDKRVGLIGMSYPGHTQILVAAQRPKYLKAISPSAVTASTYDQIIYPGGIYNLGFAGRWSEMYQPILARQGIAARVAWGDTSCAATVASRPAPSLVKTTIEHPFNDDWWKTRSLETYVDKVAVPTFLSQSWQDNQTGVAGATELYERLEVPKKLALGPGGHGWVYRLESVQRSLVRWMDYWVRGIDNGIGNEPAVDIYWESETSAASVVERWSTQFEQWPVETAQAQTFYMTKKGELSDAPPARHSEGEAEAALSYLYPLGVELTGGNAQFSIRTEPLGSLTWTSAPMIQDSTILGSVEVRFFVAIDRDDTDFVVTLHDVYPNGDVQYLQRDYLRASMREVDPGKSSARHVWRPYDKRQPLVPGTVYEIRMTMPPLGAVLRSGHRLSLSLTAPSPITQPDWGLVGLSGPGRNKIFVSEQRPSRVIVPIILGAAPERTAPTCGSMAFQPCRVATVGN